MSPTRRIADAPALTASIWHSCVHPDHNPLAMDLIPGSYEHRCPQCHQVQMFTIVEVKNASSGSVLEGNA